MRARQSAGARLPIRERDPRGEALNTHREVLDFGRAMGGLDRSQPCELALVSGIGCHTVRTCANLEELVEEAAKIEPSVDLDAVEEAYADAGEIPGTGYLVEIGEGLKLEIRR